MTPKRRIAPADDLDPAAEALLEVGRHEGEVAHERDRLGFGEASAIGEDKTGRSGCLQGRRDRVRVGPYHDVHAVHGLGPGRIIIDNEQAPAGPQMRLSDRLSSAGDPEGIGGVDQVVVPFVGGRQRSNLCSAHRNAGGTVAAMTPDVHAVAPTGWD